MFLRYSFFIIACLMSGWGMAQESLQNVESGLVFKRALPTNISDMADIQALVPDGFTLLSTVMFNHPLYSSSPAWASVYQNTEGRRALMIARKINQHIEIDTWSYIVPCRDCGLDLPSPLNMEISANHQFLFIKDMSQSESDGTRTEATLYLSFDPTNQAWRLAELSQFTWFKQEGRMIRSHTNYLTQVARDAHGAYDGQHMTEESVSIQRIDEPAPWLNDLILY